MPATPSTMTTSSAPQVWRHKNNAVPGANLGTASHKKGGNTLRKKQKNEGNFPMEQSVQKELQITLDEAAELLNMKPEALAAFEAAYAASPINSPEAEPDNFFDVNSRMASQKLRESQTEDRPEPKELIDRIVAELLAQTRVYAFDGDLSVPGRQERLKALPTGTKTVTLEEIQTLPTVLRPQLAGNLMKRDFDCDNYLSLLGLYQKSKTAEDEKGRQTAYHMFRQGMDILDLDPVIYQMIDTNPTSMGFWLPKLVEACRGQDFFKIPATRIAKVPLPLLQLTRTEYGELTQTTLDIVDAWAQEAFKLDESKEYFIKTGIYSSKFDFRNAKVTGAKEVRELGEYLLFIHHQACQMASPLTSPCIYGAATTVEWVVRDFIQDKENCPCIYKGLPLHTEYRIFIDCDNKMVIGASPYWEPKTMKQRFGTGAKEGSPHHAHDYVIYKAREGFLMDTYNKNLYDVMEAVGNILPQLDLPGQWSLDVMQNGDDFWIIDMALAENSAFYDVVPKELQAPSEENWLPQLEAATK